MKNKKILFVTYAAVIAALYVVLTYLSALLGLDKGAVQFRFSEMLTVLPCFTPAAVPGLFIGCLLANIINGCALWDIVFGSLATLIGAVGTYLLRKYKWTAPIPPIVSNCIIMPPVIMAVYGTELPYILVLLGVLAGEVVCCGVLGYLLVGVMKKYGKHILMQ